MKKRNTRSIILHWKESKIFLYMNIIVIPMLLLTTHVAASSAEPGSNGGFTPQSHLDICKNTLEKPELKKAIEITDSVMGDWQGTFKTKTKEWQIVAKVMALGKGRYNASLFTEFDKSDDPIATLRGQYVGNSIKFEGWGDGNSYIGPDWDGVLTGDKFSGTTPGREGGTFEMHKVVRNSPTMNQTPPPGATVLFDGSDFSKWHSVDNGAIKWKLTEGSMEVVGGSGNLTTKQKFGSFKMHLEFRLPFEPELREQRRSNSGVLFGGIEIQILDNYGRRSLLKECGSIYDRFAPMVTMIGPPLKWQTYDITFTSPDKDGNASLTVLHNGVKIHDNLMVGKSSGPVSISLQDHAGPVQYRNIWLINE